jgi:hypothetical protein
MHLHHFIEFSTSQIFCKEPCAVLSVPPIAWKKEIHLPIYGLHIIKIPDEYILETISKDSRVSTIVIAGSEPLDDPLELRSFIFSARKFFPPKTRPKIIIFTKYFFEDLRKIPSWTGLYCELMQYGNIYLELGRLQGKRNEQSKQVLAFIGHQYE